jgi:hypothetical protein
MENFAADLDPSILYTTSLVVFRIFFSKIDTERDREIERERERDRERVRERQREKREK